MSQLLPFGGIELDKKFQLEEIIITPDDSNNGYFVECKLLYPEDIKRKTNKLPFSPEKKLVLKIISDFMKELKPDFRKQNQELFCGQTEENDYLIHYRMLKLFVRQGMVVNKVLYKSSLRQSRWLEKKPLGHKKLTEQMILKKTSPKEGLTLPLEKSWKMYGKN